MVHYGQKMSGNDQEIVQNGQEMVEKNPGHYQEMFKKCQEMLRVGNFRKWSENIKKWSKIIRILSKIEKQTKQRRKFILYTSSLSAEGAKAGSKKKGNAQPSSPFLWFNLFLCYFLFFSFCSYGQVDRLFHMSHGAYTPIFDGLVLLKSLHDL